MWRGCDMSITNIKIIDLVKSYLNKDKSALARSVII